MPPKSPAHLSTAARRLFDVTIANYVLEAHQLAILVKALEAYDRGEEARRIVKAEGLIVESRLGDKKAHPAAAIERDSRAAFLAGMKQLGLDYEPVANQARTSAARAARWTA